MQLLCEVQYVCFSEYCCINTSESSVYKWSAQSPAGMIGILIFIHSKSYTQIRNNQCDPYSNSVCVSLCCMCIY